MVRCHPHDNITREVLVLFSNIQILNLPKLRQLLRVLAVGSDSGSYSCRLLDPRFCKLTASRITINTLTAECHTSISVSVGLGEGLRTCILHKFRSAGLGPELSEPPSHVHPSREVQVTDWFSSTVCASKEEPMGIARNYLKYALKRNTLYVGENLNILFFLLKIQIFREHLLCADHLDHKTPCLWLGNSNGFL